MPLLDMPVAPIRIFDVLVDPIILLTKLLVLSKIVPSYLQNDT